MDKMITAKWARSTAEEILGEKAEEQIKKCERAIKNAVSSNKFSCIVGLLLESTVVIELEKRGFKLKKHQPERPMESVYYEISW